MKYYVIERDNITHIKTEKPIEYYDFFCRHERGNVTGEEVFDYEDIAKPKQQPTLSAKHLRQVTRYKHGTVGMNV